MKLLSTCNLFIEELSVGERQVEDGINLSLADGISSEVLFLE